MLKTNFKKIGYYLFKDLFWVSFALLFFFLIIEDCQPGFVSLWFEMKGLLVFTSISGLLAFLYSKHKDIKTQEH
jgi:hypothetical protein